MSFGTIGSRGVSILLFVASVALIIWIRPRFLIDPDTKDWKPFGFGPGKSCVNITSIIVLLALFAYLLSACVSSSITKWKRSVGLQTAGGAQTTSPTPVQTPEDVVQSSLQPLLPPPVPVVQLSPDRQTSEQVFGNAFGLLGN